VGQQRLILASGTSAPTCRRNQIRSAPTLVERGTANGRFLLGIRRGVRVSGGVASRFVAVLTAGGLRSLYAFAFAPRTPGYVCHLGYQSAPPRPAQYREGASLAAVFVWVSNPPKYVNMADINAPLASDHESAVERPGPRGPEPILGRQSSCCFLRLSVISFKSAIRTRCLGQPDLRPRPIHRVLPFRQSQTPGMKVRGAAWIS